MPLPGQLQANLDTLLEEVDIPTLEKASSQLTERYRTFKGFLSYEEHLAYLAARLPATYESVFKVLKHLSSFPVHSVLDLGAGPGTAEWAAREIWNYPLSVTSVECDRLFIDLALKLGSQSQWIEKNLQTPPAFDPHDLVILSYSLGELSNFSILEKIWPITNQAVVIVEPGTPKGYETMLEARQVLIEMGGHVIAPCPHNRACPLPAEDWCHFSARVERRFLHRRAKKALLPFEDEKFSYVIVGKEPPKKTVCRILRDPHRHPGHVRLFLCCPEGLQQRVIARKEGPLYKEARKASWGDSWHISTCD